MIFNNRLIEYIGEKEILNILRTNKYDKYLNAKYNRSNSSYITNCHELATFDAFDNYIAKALLNNPDTLDKSLMVAYRDFLYNTFKKIPNIIFESLMFNKEIAELLFTKEQLAEIKDYKNSTAKRCRSIYEKIKNGQKTTNEESTLFFKYLLKNIGNDNPNIINLLDDVYSRLLLLPNINNLVGKEFVLKYTSYIAKKDLRIPPVEIYLTNTDLTGVDYTHNNYGTSYGNTGIISVNKDLVLNNISPIPSLPSIIKFIQTVCHETKHSSQAYRASINDISYESFEWIRNSLFGSYLSEKNFNEYQTNYQHNEIERDANLYGWLITERILNKYAPSKKNELNVIVGKNISEFYKSSLASKRDTKKRMPKEYYNVQMMDQIISKHPSLIQKYSQLSHIYKSTGERKSFIELIEVNKRLSSSTGKNNIDKIFYDYFISDIKKGALANIDVNSLDKETKYNYFTCLGEILTKEIDAIIRSISILSKDNVVSFEHINMERITRIKYLLNYLNINQKLINDLIAEDIKEGNKHIFGFSIGIIDDKLKSLQRKFNKDKQIQETKIYEDLKSLTGSDIHGPHL